MNRRRGRLAATVELAPLIDIVFLLLIFFMVSATFIRRSELHIDLPEAGGGRPETIGAVTITVGRDGSYAVDGEPTAEAGLAQALASSLGGGQPPRAVIAADALAPHQAVVSAMDAAGQSGLTRISILTRDAASEPPLGDQELSLDAPVPAPAGSSKALPPESGRDSP